MSDFRRIQLFHGPLAMNLAFHVEIVIVAGKLHHTATAAAEPDQSAPVRHMAPPVLTWPYRY